jgi:CRP/FNR family transcriptional regulator, cyclic AMP receptor protein
MRFRCLGESPANNGTCASASRARFATSSPFGSVLQAYLRALWPCRWDGVTSRGVGLPAGGTVAGTPRRLPHGEVVIRQGDPVTCLFFVTEGAVRLSAVTSEGREVVVAILGAGEVFGECALLGSVSPVEARVVGRTDVVAMPVPLLRDVLERHPATAEELLRLIASRLHRTARALGETLASDVATRLSRRLHDLAQEHGVPASDGIQIQVPITQEELGRMVGASREAVNRTLGGFIAHGLVRKRGRTVVIPNPAALITPP